MTRRLSVQAKVSTLALAVAMVAGPSPAAAQSLQGTPTVAFGSANISEGPTTTTVTVDTGQTVIDWAPDDNAVGNFGAINFQPAGTTATFQNNIDLVGDFAVLNRVNVTDQTRIVALNGTINSLVNGQTGGSIFFYSPSGFVLTGTSIINVGSLVLSASPITVDGSGNFIIGGTVTFGQAPNPNAAINTVSDINGTSQINANGAGSYVALVAPQIHHQGDIRTDGGAALVAAEAATITFSNSNLYNITVTTGTDAATGIHVDGGTIGRNSATEGADHRAYLVAVAKNDAVTMLINNGGALGFDTATSAQNGEDNVVVLGGGYNISGGDQFGFSGVSEVPLTITNAAFTSNVDAKVTGGVAINSGDGALTFSGDLTAIGGAKTTSGGNVLIDAMNGNPLSIGGDLNARGWRRNADGSDTGLITRLGATGGSTVTVGGDVRLDSFSQGAASPGDGINGGDATGGNAQVIAGAGSTINIGQTLTLVADGIGGSTAYLGTTGGSGVGGQVFLLANNGGATINIGGSVFANADGLGGGVGGDCLVCNITGGLGRGGTVQVRANAGAPNTIQIDGDATLSAAGFGGDADLARGAGVGGLATLAAADGSTTSVGADTEVDASGFGGTGFNSETGAGTGGAGFGGEAGINTNAGTVDLTGPVFVSANGLGGQGGQGGLGQGGRAYFNATLGTIHARNSVTVAALSNGGFGLTTDGGDGLADIETTITPAITEAFLFNSSGTLTLDGLTIISASATGGDGSESSGSTGGNAQGGHAIAYVSSGTTHVTGSLFIDGSAFGGNGAIGGNATARLSPDDTTPVAAALYAQNNGSIVADGIAALTAEAVGGNGSDGNGGNAQAGEVDVVPFFGSITIGTLAIDVNGLGGNGSNGGNGGNAFGGQVDVAFGLGAAAVGGTITLGSATITGDGEGGAGGAGLDGNTGGNGGAGGNGTGGSLSLVGTAGGGTLNSGVAIVTTLGRGGAGGAGGNGDTGPGGNGGAGGIGTGGFIQTGTFSADAAPTVGGGANYSTLILDSSAFGGAGGDGGTGGGGTGTGGNGGNALGGRATFLARGVLVTADAVSLTANANGGDGGLGSTQGNGGNARTGTIAVESKDRFNHLDQRGTLDVGTVVGTAIAVGGTGTAPGTSSVIGGSYFRVLNGDATIGSLDFLIDGDVYDNSFGANYVSVRDGIATVGDFSFTTIGAFVLDASNGSMSANSIDLSAGTFVVDNINPAQAGPGTYSADTITITTGLNFITNADLVSTNPLGLTAPGLIGMRNATSINGGVTLNAGNFILAGNLTAAGDIIAFAPGNVTLGNLDAGNFVVASSGGGDLAVGTVDAVGSVQLNADGDIAADDIDAGSFILIDSVNGALSLADLTATAEIDLGALTSITLGNVTADDFDFDAGGFVTGGSIIAGTNASGTAGGAINLGNINVGILLTGGPSEQGFAVGMYSATSINVGNVAADEGIAFATDGNLTAGNFNAGTDVLTMVGGNSSIASITTPGTGRTYHGDIQMLFDNGGTEDFDPSLVLGATPLRNGGSYTVAGAISTGRIQVGAASISTAAITAPVGIYLDSASATATGALTSNGLIHAISGGSIQTGNVQSTGANILFDAGTNVATGTVGAATDAQFDASGNVSIGNANIGDDLLIDAGGNLTTGAAVAATIHATAGGLATLNGMWQSPDVDLLSNDIDIAANGGIDAGNSGLIRLGSTNGTQALIGDGLTGTGYTLTNAEFGRLSAGNLQIAARGDASAAIDMLIGNLSITGPLAGSTIDDPFGSVTFATGNPITQVPGGVIRVTGSVNASGFTDTNSLEFFADRFELDAATGLINITSTGTTLSGELFIAANRIHVASASILDQLAANPNYQGHEDDLNAPAAVQRPDGVIRAGSIEAFSNNPLAVLVQNTGTADTPAGFLTFGDEPLLTGAEGQVGPIEMIINGQLLTQGGLLTGADVLDFLIDANNVGFFTANSSINGCSLTGACTSSSPIPPGSTPTPGIQDVITLIGDDAMPPPPFGNEDVIDDNDEDTDDSETSPIIPPDPLFDTSELSDAAGSDAPEVVGTPMRSTPGLTNSGDVDDPVSGSGNPGLMETPPPPINEEKQQ